MMLQNMLMAYGFAAAIAVGPREAAKGKTYKMIIESSGEKCKAQVHWNEKLKKRIAMR